MLFYNRGQLADQLGSCGCLLFAGEHFSQLSLTLGYTAGRGAKCAGIAPVEGGINCQPCLTAVQEWIMPSCPAFSLSACRGAVLS